MIVTKEVRPAMTTQPAPAPPVRYRSDTIEFAPHPAAVAEARLHTRQSLRAWALNDLYDEAAQIVSELTTNSVEAHRREGLVAPVRLTLLAGLRTVLIAVHDASPVPPVVLPLDDDAESGRGLFIVEALAAAWSWKLSPSGGKTVRVLLRGARPA